LPESSDEGPDYEATQTVLSARPMDVMQAPLPPLIPHADSTDDDDETDSDSGDVGVWNW
jgi:hypothetical protein